MVIVATVLILSYSGYNSAVVSLDWLHTHTSMESQGICQKVIERVAETVDNATTTARGVVSATLRPPCSRHDEH